MCIFVGVYICFKKTKEMKGNFCNWWNQLLFKRCLYLQLSNYLPNWPCPTHLPPKKEPFNCVEIPFFHVKKPAKNWKFPHIPKHLRKKTTAATATRARDGHANIPRPTTSVASLPLHQLLHRFPSWRGLKGPPPKRFDDGTPMEGWGCVYHIYIYKYIYIYLPITDPWDWYVFLTWTP